MNNLDTMPLDPVETIGWAIEMLVLIAVVFAVWWAWDKMKGRDDE